MVEAKPDTWSFQAACPRHRAADAEADVQLAWERRLADGQAARKASELGDVWGRHLDF